MSGVVSARLLRDQVVLIAVLSSVTTARPATTAQQFIGHSPDQSFKEPERHHQTNARLYGAATEMGSLMRKEVVGGKDGHDASMQLDASYQDLVKVYMKQWAGCNDSAEVHASTRKLFSDFFQQNAWGAKARSGMGSTIAAAKPFTDFLLKFIHMNDVQSIAEVSCGHWPSGWQSRITWPKIRYHGIDIVEGVIKENRALLAQRSDNFGFKDAEFHVGDMACDYLPAADLLLVKDTLQHLSFDYIKQFLRKNVFGPSKRHKFVMFVNDMLEGVEDNIDIKNGGQRHLEMTAYPFHLQVKKAFAWKAADMKKIAEVLDVDKESVLDPIDIATVSQVRDAVYDYSS